MRRLEAGQLDFITDPQDVFRPTPAPEKPAAPEAEYRPKNVITFSQIEKVIYQEAKSKPRNTFDASLAIGAAVDYFLVPANFVYRFRNDFCFPAELYPEWDLKEVFSRFYPTGWDFGKILELLEIHRPNFYRTLQPANLALERQNIKRALSPLWDDVAKQFQIDALQFQSTMAQQGNLLLPSGENASSQTVAEIGHRIVDERFGALVDDDKNYSYIAKPDCLLIYEREGTTFHILVQPDYIKRLREKRKTVRKRHIIAKRIIGDFKYSDKKELANYHSPFGQSMLVYNFLLSQIGERFKQNQRSQVKFPDRRVRRVFLIPQEVRRPLPAKEVQTGLEFLREEGKEIFYQMPPFTPELQQSAASILKDVLLKSRQIGFN